MTDNLYDLFRSRFPGDLSRPFIETPEGRVWSFDDVETGSARFANLLAATGVQKGDRVAVQVEKSPEALLLYLACLRRGAVFLPLNTAYLTAEIEYFLGDARPALVVCLPSERAAVAALAGSATVMTLGAHGEGSLMEAASAGGGSFDTVPTAPDDIAAILYTSGTTGRSKGAMLTHRNLAGGALTLQSHWRLGAADVLLHALPIYHMHGLFVASHCMLLSGGKMLFMPRFDAAEAIRLMARATVFMGVPTLYVRMLAEPSLNSETTRNMRLFVSGSAPLLAETFNNFQERTGHAVLERYGLTETGMITSNPLEGERIAGSVGLPLPDAEVRIADEEGKVLENNEIGVLEVKGPNVFKGYWEMPEKTAAEFRGDGFFITGDLAHRSGNGYVTLVGRVKDLIISGGLNVYPREVEAVIDALDGVDESAVIGLPHPEFGEAVTAIVKPAGNPAALSEAAIIAGLKDKLANFKVPKAVRFVDELPRNAMGKVQKNALRERYQSLYTSGGHQ